MPIRGARPLTFRPFGVCDAIDATNTQAGMMSSLKDLIPNPTTKGQFVPRPASTQVTNFAGFTAPTQGEALLVVGTRAYGMIASGRNAGKSEPFCYDLVGGTFIAIGNVTNANTPTSQGTTGDWAPSILTMIGNRIVITHPGYDGITNFVGWIDMRNFTSASLTGSTHTSTLIDTLSSNPLNAGWMVGDKIAGTNIPANTFIVAITATSVTLSQATTGTTAGVALTVTSGTPAAPLYGAGQTNGQPLAAVPTAVANFNGRAYYAVNNGVQFADSLNPLQITNATQALTLGDNVAVNALGGVPLGNQVIGGTLQALIAFKQDSGYFQITGDPATNNLASNFVAGSVGTRAPLSLAATPYGLAYIAPDGLRIIDLSGKSSEPIGSYGDGVSLPFLFAVNSSRICAAFDQNLVRVSVQNGAKNGQPVEEYWFDLVLKKWTGPHTFPASLIVPYHSGTNDFVLFANGINGKLWASKAAPSASSTYTENGNALTVNWQTTLLPDNEQGLANQVIESALGLSLPSSQALTVSAFDEQGNTLDAVTLSGSSAGNAIWGSFTWGTGVWGGATAAYEEYALKWHVPLVFKQMSVQIVGQSTAGLVIGNLYAKYQTTGYFGAHAA